MDLRVFEAQKANRQLVEDLDKFKLATADKFDLYKNKFSNKDDQLESRLKKAEEEIELLKARPVATGGSSTTAVAAAPQINTANFLQKSDLTELYERLDTQERYMKEHDERFTNYEHRIAKLEEMISEPMDRIEALEKRVDNLKFELNNKVSN